MTRFACLLCCLLALAAHAQVQAQPQVSFRIGTGGQAGTYYPVGQLIARAISGPGLSAQAVPSNGSVANINGMVAGAYEAGLAQADVSHGAHAGTGIYEQRPRVETLRVLANLYPESLHLLVGADRGIAGIADLRGRAVSLDEPGSGTLADARAVLAAFGLGDRDVRAVYLKPDQAGVRLRDRQLDGLFFVGGYPAASIATLAAETDVALLALAGPEIAALIRRQPFFQPGVIPAGTYRGVPETPTLSVGAQLVTLASLPDATAYQVVKALWSDEARKILDSGHAQGKVIRLATAVAGLGLPLHPGAARFYREAGVLPPGTP